MLLFDSVYINNSGGKALLDYLTLEIEKNHLRVFYLFDQRTKDSFDFIEHKKRNFVRATLINRFKFYFQHKNEFESVLCFGNVPPPIRVSNAIVFTYFHNSLILNYPKDYPIRKKIYVNIQRVFLRIAKQNTNYWVVQSTNIALALAQRFNIDQDQIKTIPFFYVKESDALTDRKLCYIYASSGSPHKNVGRLLSAWDELHQRGYSPLLHLTISEEWVDLNRRIQTLNQKGLKIVNHGILSNDALMLLYHESEYLIYPSLTESFGLPLIEAVKAGCKILAADLPYTYSVIKPSLTFDPYDVQSITKAVEVSLRKDLPNSECLVNNEISKLLGLFS